METQLTNAVESDRPPRCTACTFATLILAQAVRRSGQPLTADVSAPRKAWRIWSGESPGMVRVNHPPLPSGAPLAERCLGHGDWGIREQER